MYALRMYVVWRRSLFFCGQGEVIVSTAFFIRFGLFCFRAGPRLLVPLAGFLQDGVMALRIAVVHVLAHVAGKVLARSTGIRPPR